MTSLKPVLFGLILAGLAYFYFRGVVGIVVGGSFFMIGLCVAFLSSEDKKMKQRKAACKASVKPEDAVEPTDTEEKEDENSPTGTENLKTADKNKVWKK